MKQYFKYILNFITIPKIKSYRQYLYENGDYIQKLHDKNTQSACTLEYMSLRRYIKYLMLVNYSPTKIKLLNLLSIRLYKAFSSSKYNEQASQNHIENVEYIMNKL